MTLNEGTWVVDAEYDSLEPTKVHCLGVTNDGSDVHVSYSYDEMRRFLTSASTLICHNFERFDKVHLERLLGIKIKAKIIDTLAFSWYVEHDRLKHGLEEWGVEFGVPKPKVNDWVNATREELTHRVTEDCKINYLLWERILTKLRKIYETPESLSKLIDYLEFKMQCARLQEESGWKLDLEYCSTALVDLQEKEREAVEHLGKIMPKVPVYVTKTQPKKLRNKKGELTKLGREWYNLLHEKGCPEDTISVDVLHSYKQPNPGSPQQVKAWLDSLGWIPETIKQVKEEDGTYRDIPQINKENQKGGGICDSIKKLYPKEPNLEWLDGLSIIRHRIGLLNGFLRDQRHGYLKARITGFTNTLRVQHKEVVNLPRSDRKYAEPVRGSLICEDDEILIGGDLSSLEDRLKQHFIYPFDPEYVKEMSAPDYDPHLSLAILAEEITPEQSEKYKSGVDKSIKPIRDTFKSTNYCCQYGGYPPRIALTAAVSLAKAKNLFKVYWQKNWAIKEVVKTLKVKTVGDELWQYNPVSGLWYNLRSTNDQFSTLVQGTAAYVFDLWLYYVLRERSQLTASFHDEGVWVEKTHDADLVKSLLHKAIDEVNNALGLNRELAIGVQQGKRYSEIH